MIQESEDESDSASMDHEIEEESGDDINKETSQTESPLFSDTNEAWTLK